MTNPAKFMDLREYFAAHVDVAVYEPKDLYCAVEGHDPTVAELADFIAFLRTTEADAIMKRLGL